jgi:hypothetical protein
MPVVGQTFRLYYMARNRAPALADVRYFVVTPGGAVEGVFSMFEFAPGNPALAGLYFGDYTPAAVGHYVVFADSASQPLLDQRGFFAEAAGAGEFTDADRKTLAAVLAKPFLPIAGGRVHPIVVPRLEDADKEEIAEAVWRAKQRSLTDAVEIAGEKRTLDALNDLSRDEATEAAKTGAGEALDERGYGAELARKLAEVETQESAAARAEKVAGEVREGIGGFVARLVEKLDALAGVAESVKATNAEVAAAIRTEVAKVKAGLEELGKEVEWRESSIEKAQQAIARGVLHLVDVSTSRKN